MLLFSTAINVVVATTAASVNEGSSIAACVQIFGATLERDFSVMVATRDGTAEGIVVLLNWLNWVW